VFPYNEPRARDRLERHAGLHNGVESRLPRVMTMPIHLTCPSCQDPVAADDRPAGGTVQCPRCHTLLPVPARDYYEVLQVSPNADKEAIWAAYRLQAMRRHTDTMSGGPTAGERMNLLNEAWEVLSDPRKRRVHDLKRPAAKIGEVVAQPHQATPNEEPRQGRNSPEAKKSFGKGAQDAQSLEACWFCNTHKPDGKPLSIRLHPYESRTFSHQEATIEIPRCSRCARVEDDIGWIGKLGFLLMFLGGCLLPASWSADLGKPASEAVYIIATVLFCGGCVAFLLGWVGPRLHQKYKAKQFPSVLQMLHDGWEIG
jgi:hypothetical protein